MCLNDNNQSSLAIINLIYALQTKIQEDPMNFAFTELMLTFEEEKNIAAARAVAHWSISGGGTQWENIYQRPGFVYDGLKSYGFDENKDERTKILSRPHYSPTDPGYPRWCHILKKHYNVIQKEFLELLEKKKLPFHWPQVGERVEHDQSVVSNGDWREIVLFGPNVTTLPNEIGAPSSIAPQTKHLIQTYAPDVVSLCNLGGGEVIFSMLAPHTYIYPHCASSNIRLTAHLGLMIPDAIPSYFEYAEFDHTMETSRKANRPKCGIRINTEWHQWEEGEFLVFDDSFEHEVVNDTDKCRCVMLLRFWHPGIHPSMWNDIMAEISRQKKNANDIRFVPPL